MPGSHCVYAVVVGFVCLWQAAREARLRCDENRDEGSQILARKIRLYKQRAQVWSPTYLDPLLKIHHEEESFGGPKWKISTSAHHLEEHLPSQTNLQCLLSQNIHTIWIITCLHGLSGGSETRLLCLSLTLCSLGEMFYPHAKNVIGRLVLISGKSEEFLICQAEVWGEREPLCLQEVGRGISLQWLKNMKAEPGIPCDFFRLYG